MTICGDNVHLGRLIIESLLKRPDAICQIDAATGESETNASVLARSIQLARCLRKFGVKPGEVLALGGKNHLDLHIPFYAASMIGVPIAGVDPSFKAREIKHLFQICSPRIAFCQKELLDTYKAVVEELGLNTEVICFDEGKHSLANFIEQYDEKEDQEEFKPVTINPSKHYAWLIGTGGTSGVIKLAAFTHESILRKLEILKVMSPVYAHLPERENTIFLNLASVHWVSSFMRALSAPLMRQTKVQTSNPHTTEHIIEIINKYKPRFAFLGPILTNAIIKSEKKCDFSHFDRILLTGGKISMQIHLELRKRVRPEVAVVELYGQTENLGPVLVEATEPIGNCGTSLPTVPAVKIVDPKTGKEITEPNVPGEIWVKGAVFSGYYNDPEETAANFTEDGWYRTGDILYRDENGNFFFVERLNMMIKCGIGYVAPTEIEAVIREHPGVHDVGVTRVPHEDEGEHPVACVMRCPGSNVTAEEIKEIVAKNLPDTHRIRGGVIFIDQLPVTSAGKIARDELRKMVQTMKRE